MQRLQLEAGILLSHQWHVNLGVGLPSFIYTAYGDTWTISTMLQSDMLRHGWPLPGSDISRFAPKPFPEATK